VILDSDEDHCGKCNNKCDGDTPYCQNGECVGKPDGMSSGSDAGATLQLPPGIRGEPPPCLLERQRSAAIARLSDRLPEDVVTRLQGNTTERS
jgi:hypothetical protein